MIKHYHYEENYYWNIYYCETWVSANNIIEKNSTFGFKLLMILSE